MPNILLVTSLGSCSGQNTDLRQVYGYRTVSRKNEDELLILYEAYGYASMGWGVGEVGGLLVVKWLDINRADPSGRAV